MKTTGDYWLRPKPGQEHLEVLSVTSPKKETSITLGGTTLDVLKVIDRVANDLDLRGGLNSPPSGWPRSPSAAKKPKMGS